MKTFSDTCFLKKVREDSAFKLDYKSLEKEIELNSEGCGRKAEGAEGGDHRVEEECEA